MLMIPLLASTDVKFWPILIGVVGGLALFLLGLEQMTESLKSAAGDRLRAVLGRLTRNRFAAAVTGAVITGVIQSSSVTTVLVVGFVSAGLMTLQQSVGVIMGANIGSTVTAQIIALKVTDSALLLIALGFFPVFFTRRRMWQHAARVVMGLGMIFLGMNVMSQSTIGLRTYEPFIGLMANMDNPLLGIVVGALFTAIVQSSAATTGIVIVLAGQGVLSLEAGIAVALGANIGTCLTALLAAIGKPRTALRAATVHVLFNLIGVAAWVGFIGVLASLARAISPTASDLSGVERIAAEAPRQIANAHTLFNIANTVMLIGFTGPLARLVQWLVPLRKSEPGEPAKPKFIDATYLATPALAIDRVRMEVAHLGGLTVTLLRQLRQIPDGHEPNERRVAHAAADVDIVYRAVIDYCRKLLAYELSPSDSGKLAGLMQASNTLQSIAETAELNLLPLLRRWSERGLRASAGTAERMSELERRVDEHIQMAVAAITDPDATSHATAIIADKSHVNRLAEALAHRLSDRLVSADPHRLSVYELETQRIELNKRLYYFAKRIAKLVNGESDDD